MAGRCIFSARLRLSSAGPLHQTITTTMNHVYKTIDLLKVDYSAASGLVQLALNHTWEDRVIHIQGQNILFFALSTTEGDMPPFVVDLAIREHAAQEVNRLMLDLGYSWTLHRAPEVVHHLHAEGGVVLDIVASSPFIVFA